LSNEHTLGAVPVGEGEVEFRVWAPHARSVAVRLGSGDAPLEPGEVWQGRAAAKPGDDYVFVVDGEELRDPCSRCQPRGVLGPSRVVEVPRGERLGVPLESLVLYELHVGTFSAEGTFDGVVPYLPRLRELVDVVRLAADAVARAKANGHGPSQELIDAAVAELDDGDIVVRDPASGLIDFHARGTDGVVYFLCWKADDDDLAWWHLPDEGFAGRKPLPREPESESESTT
jgi:hypothetical protein